MFPNPFNNPKQRKDQPKNIHTNPLFTPITLYEEVQIVGGVPKNFLPDEIGNANERTHFENLKRLENLQTRPTPPNLNPNYHKTTN